MAEGDIRNDPLCNYLERETDGIWLIQTPDPGCTAAKPGRWETGDAHIAEI